MPRLRFVIPGLLVMALVALGGSAGRSATADGYVPPASPPPEYQATYDELSQELTTFESQLDTSWNGSVGSGQFAGALSAANGNKSVGLLTPANWTRIVQMLDAYQAMGVQLIKLEVQYPVLTPAFHAYETAHPPPAVPVYTATVQNFIGTPTSFYNKLVAEIRSRGMGVWMEYGTLFGEYSATPPAPYFADMRTAGIDATRVRYTAERAAESALIVSQLKPDYYTVIEEPSTQAMNFGYFPGQTPIFDTSGWTGFVQSMTSAIAAAAPNSTTLLGAGAGVWDPPEFVTAFAAMPELDYVDLHIYPLASMTKNYLQTMLDLADLVRSIAPGKNVTIGEAWTYKTTKAEVGGGIDYNLAYSRDVYSFWEPIDRQFLDLLFKMMQYKGLMAIMPFWSQYYFAYLTYGDPNLDGLSGVQLIGAAASAATPNIASQTLTGTGERFEELLAMPRDADGDGVSDTTDASDTDGDGVADNLDACPLVYTTWPVPAGDRDCDGYPDTVAASGIAPESAIGTRPLERCAQTPPANDEPLADAWPPDFNDDQKAGPQDVLKFSVPVYGSHSPGPPYSLRFDWDGNGAIGPTDVLKVIPFYGKSCV